MIKQAWCSASKLTSNNEGIEIVDSTKMLDPEAKKGSLSCVVDDATTLWIKKDEWEPFIQNEYTIPPGHIHDVYLDLPEWMSEYWTSSTPLNLIEGVENPWEYIDSTILLDLKLEIGDEINIYNLDKFIVTLWVTGLDFGSIEPEIGTAVLMIAIPKEFKSIVSSDILRFFISLIMATDTVSLNEDTNTRTPLIVYLNLEGQEMCVLKFNPFKCVIETSGETAGVDLPLDSSSLILTQWLEDLYNSRGRSFSIDSYFSISVPFNYEIGGITTHSSYNMPSAKFKGFPLEIYKEKIGSLSYTKDWMVLNKDTYKSYRELNLEPEDFIALIDKVNKLENPLEQ